MNLKKDFKGFVNSKFGKTALLSTSAVSMVATTVSPALAVGTADTAVVTGITSITDNVIATIGAIGPVVIGIFAAFVMWKYGKRIFNKIG